MLQLRDIMTMEVATVTPETTLRELAELLAGRHVGGVPVLEGARVVGVVSASDLLTFQAATPDGAGEREEPLAWDDADEVPDWAVGGEPSSHFFTELWSDGAVDVVERLGGGPRLWGEALSEHTVAEVMTRRVHALPPAADVSAAARRMHASNVHRVLVMECGRLVGIVTTMDVVRAVADHRFTHRAFTGHAAGAAPA